MQLHLTPRDRHLLGIAATHRHRHRAAVDRDGEAQRVAAIQRVAAEHGLSNAWSDKRIASGTSAADARAEAEALVARATAAERTAAAAPAARPAPRRDDDGLDPVLIYRRWNASAARAQPAVPIAPDDRDDHGDDDDDDELDAAAVFKRWNRSGAEPVPEE